MTFTSNGLEMSKCTVAVTCKKTGEQELTDWFSLVVYDKLASTANQYLHKGRRLSFEGRLETFEYTKDEQKRKGYDSVVTNFTRLDPKKARYAKRAGIEGTISQGTRGFGLRQSRYIGQTKVLLQHILTSSAINLVRFATWIAGVPHAKTRTSRFAALKMSSVS